MHLFTVLEVDVWRGCFTGRLLGEVSGALSLLLGISLIFCLDGVARAAHLVLRLWTSPARLVLRWRGVECLSDILIRITKFNSRAFTDVSDWRNLETAALLFPAPYSRYSRRSSVRFGGLPTGCSCVFWCRCSRIWPSSADSAVSDGIMVQYRHTEAERRPWHRPAPGARWWRHSGPVDRQQRYINAKHPTASQNHFNISLKHVKDMKLVSLFR